MRMKIYDESNDIYCGAGNRQGAEAYYQQRENILKNIICTTIMQTITNTNINEVKQLTEDILNDLNNAGIGGMDIISLVNVNKLIK